MNRVISIGFIVAGIMSYFWPGFNGYFFPPSEISAGDGRIVASILLVGAAILWFIRTPPND
jgi:hypothetical protein